MRDVSHKTDLALLKGYVMQWKVRAGSRESVAIAIVEMHRVQGLDRATGIFFESSGDHFTLAKNAADRIFRWLDDETKDTNLMPMNFARSVLMAMPLDLRMAYQNDILAPLGFAVRGIDEGGVSLDATTHLVSIAKESAEAQAAVASLIDGATPAELHEADQQLAEAEEAIRKARVDVRQHLGAQLKVV